MLAKLFIKVDKAGGATDFRLIGGDWNNLEGLKSRILVAGGGGGAQSSCGGNNTSAGHGGGLEGVYSKNLAGAYVGHIAYGGNQSAGGSYVYGSNSSYVGSQGSFGCGASAPTCAAGGGGGYYGGGSVYTAGGGGGSSFVAGWEGCDNTYSDYHKNINGDQLVFKDVKFLQGNNDGNGYAILSYISAN